MIVEDEEAIANLIRIDLTAEGYQCVCAYDGKTGADYIEKGGLEESWTGITISRPYSGSVTGWRMGNEAVAKQKEDFAANFAHELKTPQRIVRCVQRWNFVILKRNMLILAMGKRD